MMMSRKQQASLTAFFGSSKSGSKSKQQQQQQQPKPSKKDSDADENENVEQTSHQVVKHDHDIVEDTLMDTDNEDSGSGSGSGSGRRGGGDTDIRTVRKIGHIMNNKNKKDDQDRCNETQLSSSKVEISSITGKPIRSKKKNRNRSGDKRAADGEATNDKENVDVVTNDTRNEMKGKASSTVRNKKENGNGNGNGNGDEKDKKKHQSKKARLVIEEEDDDEEDDNGGTKDVEMKEQDKEDQGNLKNEGDDDEEDVPLDSLKPKSKPKSKKQAKKETKNQIKNHANNANNAFTAISSKKKKDSPSSKSKQLAKSKVKTTLNPKNEDNTTLKENTPIPYSILTETLSSIEEITGRLEIQSHLTKLFSLCILKQPKDLITLVYLASNSVAPAYKCVELGIGDAILIKAIGEASGSNANMVKQKYEADGDLGTVAMNAKGKQRTLGFGRKPKPLTSNEVLETFRKIANITGSQSQKSKVDLIKGLLVRATQKGNESKYIIRGLQGKLRIGLAQSTVLISLAHAVLTSCPFNQQQGKEEDSAKSPENEEELSSDCRIVKNIKLALDTRLESAVNIVKKAYSEVSSFDALVEALISTPLWKLHQSCSLQPGFPVTPMLAKPTKSIQEVLKRLNGKRFTCEYKYDGERAQVHMQNDGLTKVFSRSLLDTSEKFPEVPEYVKEACVGDVKSFILDTEVVAYNRETKQFVPFQVLSTRKKTEESRDNAKVKVIVQAFDLMYLNGESLLDHTLAERRELLLKHFKVVDGKFQFATSLDHKEDGDTTLIEDFLDAAVKGQCEGLMVKTLDENASYQPSYRSLNWLKLKKDYLEGMGDSVDLVPIGAYHGRGKRTGVYGAYLLACYDLDSEEFQSVCKIGTGFSDEDLKTLAEGLKDKIIPEKSSQYNTSSTLECDVWFEASQVWEVKAADLSKSSTHKGAVDRTGESGRGIGLRFPRFERLREDKRPEDATTSDQILEMYYAQDSIVDDGIGDFGDDGI